MRMIRFDYAPDREIDIPTGDNHLLSLPAIFALHLTGEAVMGDGAVSFSLATDEAGAFSALRSAMLAAQSLGEAQRLLALLTVEDREHPSCLSEEDRQACHFVMSGLAQLQREALEAGLDFSRVLNPDLKSRGGRAHDGF